jgi:hypothetical protein
MLDHVAASFATVAKPVSISPDKAALKYLEASGAAPIFVTEVDGVATIRTGSKVDPRAVVVFWIAEVDAKPVVSPARTKTPTTRSCRCERPPSSAGRR